MHNTCINAYTHANMHTYTHVCKHIHAHIIQIYMHEYTYAHKNTCMNIHVTCIYAHNHIYIHTNKHTHIFIHTGVGVEGMTGHNMDVPFPSHSCSAVQCTGLSLRKTENVPSRRWISHMLWHLAWSEQLLKNP